MGAPADNENTNKAADPASAGQASATPATGAEQAAAAASADVTSTASTGGAEQPAATQQGGSSQAAADAAGVAPEAAEAAEAPEAAAKTAATPAEPLKPEVKSTGPATVLNAYQTSSEIPADHVGLQLHDNLTIKYYGWNPGSADQVAAANKLLFDPNEGLVKGGHRVMLMENLGFGGTGTIASALEHKPGSRYVATKTLAGG